MHVKTWNKAGSHAASSSDQGWNSVTWQAVCCFHFIAFISLKSPEKSCQGGSSSQHRTRLVVVETGTGTTTGAGTTTGPGTRTGAGLLGLQLLNGNAEGGGTIRVSNNYFHYFHFPGLG